MGTHDLDSLVELLRARFGYSRSTRGRRKIRLYVCGCWRQVEKLAAPDPYAERVVLLAERFADGEATKAELSAAEANKEESPFPTGSPGLLSRGVAESALYAAPILGTGSARYWAEMVAIAAAPASEKPTAGPRMLARLESVLRCVVGNPFRPESFSPAWRTSTVKALAQEMYAARDFSAMPILADALQDAGCGDEAILTHCRGPGPHVRGCHVVDACLGKA